METRGQHPVYPTLVLRQGLSLNLGLADLVGLAGHWVPEPPVCLSRAGITGGHGYAWLFTWVLGI